MTSPASQNAKKTLVAFPSELLLVALLNLLLNGTAEVQAHDVYVMSN